MPDKKFPNPLRMDAKELDQHVFHDHAFKDAYLEEPRFLHQRLHERGKPEDLHGHSED